MRSLSNQILSYKKLQVKVYMFLYNRDIIAMLDFELHKNYHIVESHTVVSKLAIQMSQKYFT